MLGLPLVVVGGGAAGLLAAWRAASTGRSVTLLEANPRLAVKVRISGGGKCNVTHAGPIRELLHAFSPDQARFLRPALHAFSNDDLRDLLRRKGVETYARDNGRVFPLDRPGSAAEVVAALEGLVRASGVEVRLGTRVVGLLGTSPRLTGIRLEGGVVVPAEAVILATGGASYPETGTRGEVLGWLEALGVPVRPWFPALAPIPLVRPRPDWEGISLRGGTLVLQAGQEGRILSTFSGDIVFTRQGISGPAALELSQGAEAARRAGAAWLSFRIDPGTCPEAEADLRSLQGSNPHLLARSWLHRRLPERTCGALLAEAGIPPGQKLKDLSREGRKALVRMATALPLGVPGPVPLARGEVAAGGVGLQAVEPRTLAVKGWENLRVCGELLDLDGPVGGYNLQAAFSTGFLAGSP